MYRNNYHNSNTSYSELEAFFAKHLTKEDRYFSIRGSKSNNTVRIDVSSIKPYDENSIWQPGIVRQACEDVLTLLNIGYLSKIRVNERFVYFSYTSIFDVKVSR